VSERTQKDTELIDGNIYDRSTGEGASSAKRSFRSLSEGTRDLRPGCSSYQLAPFVNPTGS